LRRKREKKERRARGEIDDRVVDDDDFDVNFKVVDFSDVDLGMGGKKFTSRFSFVKKDTSATLDKHWDGGDEKDESDFWKSDEPSAAQQAADEKAEAKAAKKEERKKQKTEALAAQEEAEEEEVKQKEEDKKSKKDKKKVRAPLHIRCACSPACLHAAPVGSPSSHTPMAMACPVHAFECFPYVCPEPVLVKRLLLY
jgi:hypothetical protein